LFNEVQELKGGYARNINSFLHVDPILVWAFSEVLFYWSGNIRVYCRIRPSLPNEDHKSSITELIGDNGELILANPTSTGREGRKLFKFNKVLGPTSSQGTDENVAYACIFKDNLFSGSIRCMLICLFIYF
jgi:hypothetical protein